MSTAYPFLRSQPVWVRTPTWIRQQVSFRSTASNRLMGYQVQLSDDGVCNTFRFKNFNLTLDLRIVNREIYVVVVVDGKRLSMGFDHNLRGGNILRRRAADVQCCQR
jgi:hypothetical protein